MPYSGRATKPKINGSNARLKTLDGMFQETDPQELARQQGYFGDVSKWKEKGTLAWLPEPRTVVSRFIKGTPE